MSSRALVLLATALFAAAALTIGGESRHGPPLRATAGGSLQLESSHDGVAVLRAAGLRPGGSAEGTLTLTSRAPGPQRLTLAASDLRDTPGAGGGALSSWLDLRISRGADEVFAGKLSDLSALDLGDLAPGSSTPFRFVVTLPEHGPAVDDAYAGGSVEVAWSWRGDAQTGPPDDGPSVAADPPSAPVAPPGDVVPAEREREAAPPPALPSVDELEGPPGVRGDVVRLWLGGRSTQRLGTALGVSAACRPGCAVRAAARVRVGRRWRSLGRRSLGAVAARSQPVALRFRLSALQQRSLRATLRRHGPLTVRISVTAVAPGHVSVTKVRTLRLAP